MLKLKLNKIKKFWSLLNSPIYIGYPIQEEKESIVEDTHEDDFDMEDFKNSKLMKKPLGGSLQERAYPVKVSDFPIVGNVAATMDSSVDGFNKTSFDNALVSQIQLDWYVSHGFIGYESCAIIAQHWLVNRACRIVGLDAIRHGFEITSNSGKELKADVIDDIRRLDDHFKFNDIMSDFSYFNRMFGIRIAIPIIKTKDKKYYEKPFNIDGVTEGSYQGMQQIDPFWITPILDGDAAGNPASPDFYIPTWWQVNGRKFHKSHLIIINYVKMSDILKPNYIFGGIPLPQMIYERVYAAERSADEVPQLLLTKRLTVLRTNTKKVLQQLSAFLERIQIFTNFKNNQGLQIIDEEEQIEQIDTTLTDVHQAVDGQYDLVSAISEVPVDKLMVRQKKGSFGNVSSNEDERSNYMDVLENEQVRLNPLVIRHHELLIKSHIEPKQGDQPQISHQWNPATSPNSEDLADIRKKNAETAEKYIMMGVLTPEEVRNKLVSDKNSGYQISDNENNKVIDYSEYDDDDYVAAFTQSIYPTTI